MLRPKKNYMASRNIKRRTIVITLGGLLLLVAAAISSLQYGSTNYSIQTVMDVLLSNEESGQASQIILDIRMPRMVVALLIGGYLAVSGAIMQGLTRNALAEPGLLGISSGAAFVLVIALAIVPGLSTFGTTAAAMLGATIAMVLIVLLASYVKGGASPVKLTLAGMAIGMFLTSLTTAISLYFDVTKDMSFWYAGSLSTATWDDARLLVIFGAIAIPVLIYLLHPLTLLRFGEDVASSLGVRIKIVQLLSIITILLLTGSSVSVAGAISFVGLIVPHISKMLVGGDFRYMIPVSTVLGSLLLVLADVGSKLMNPPFETPVGVVTALLGVPFFLYLIQRKGGSMK
ncbi:FecCD family ABC transporter permease [Jeotgalibacillus soli]|uniref:Ferrichrome ABC transporter permease n=1 Tax=Jeotgalibacillus soli TaxID=889306 RepID=A0A0C2V5M4_9BACL|nr:iron ABC transporter permease [Jeotgalibacillus soli]KIL44297.1 hypothetical protein KP78_32610 [Jeotgalibacillus soli]